MEITPGNTPASIVVVYRLLNRRGPTGSAMPHLKIGVRRPVAWAFRGQGPADDVHRHSNRRRPDSAIGGTQLDSQYYDMLPAEMAA